MSHTTSRLSLLIAGIGAATVLLSTNARPVQAQPAIDAMVVAGVDQDSTAIARVLAGGLFGFGKLAVDAHIAFEGFLRIDSSKGIAARSLPAFDLGLRYGIKSDRFVGPFIAAGAGLGLFSGKPHERKVVGDAATCATEPPDGTPEDCTFRIDKNAVFRFGLGWGFKQSSALTVAVRVDFAYWMFSVSSFEDQPIGAPIPREIPRPQSSMSILIGLEFMRWGD